MMMLESSMSKAERRVFNTFQSTASVLDYLEQQYDIQYGGDTSQEVS